MWQTLKLPVQVIDLTLAISDFSVNLRVLDAIPTCVICILSLIPPLTCSVPGSQWRQRKLPYDLSSNLLAKDTICWRRNYKAMINRKVKEAWFIRTLKSYTMCVYCNNIYNIKVWYTLDNYIPFLDISTICKWVCKCFSKCCSLSWKEQK